jgi:hypothetical protein
MTTDNRTDFHKMVDATIDSHISDRREHAGPDRRQLNHLPMTEKRDGRTADRRTVVVNTAVRPAGGPNGKSSNNDTINAIVGSPLFYGEVTLHMKKPVELKPDDVDWATVPGTDEHELATLDRACEDENRALKTCCQGAAIELTNLADELMFNTGRTSGMPLGFSTDTVAAIIYKHMRNGREL